MPAKLPCHAQLLTAMLSCSKAHLLEGQPALLGGPKAGRVSPVGMGAPASVQVVPEAVLAHAQRKHCLPAARACTGVVSASTQPLPMSK